MVKPMCFLSDVGGIVKIVNCNIFICGKFEMFKSKNQKNKLNNLTLKLIQKISVKILNLKFGVVHSY